MIPLRDTIRVRNFPAVNWLLIGINTAVFIYELNLGSSALTRFIHGYGMVPAYLNLLNPYQLLLHPAPLVTLITSMFIHSGWLHILGNMWVLFIFGDNIEDRLGPGVYLSFYLSSGLIANLLQAFVFPDSTLPTIGASGAIAGVLGAYFFFYPAARVLTLIPIFIIPWITEIPAVFYLGFWFLTQIFSGVTAFQTEGGQVGGVAWWAHIGGFVFGLLFAILVAYDTRAHPPSYPDTEAPEI